MITSRVTNLTKTVLVIAGSDPSGGAGIQADLKTLTSLGVYGMTAITALTEQNTKGVSGIFEIPLNFVIKQINCCLSDIGANAIKIGMMHNAELINGVYEALKQNEIIGNKKIKIVLDPVMVAKGGHRLLKEDAVISLLNFIKNTNPVLTPNIPEAEILTGMKINNLADMKTAGEKIIDLGANFVVLKGGHMNKPILSDILIGEEVLDQIETKKIETNNTHGTGCTMASALTAGLAKSLGIKEAFQKAHFYVNQAIITSPRFGKGHGPINHSFNIN
jgi:hydroxymethylpyrimidine/phosphomethylpyrimidine kinase